MGIGMPRGMAHDLVKHLGTASPRDIKMILRLGARVAAYHKEDITIEHFRQASMFRGTKWTDA